MSARTSTFWTVWVNKEAVQRQQREAPSPLPALAGGRGPGTGPFIGGSENLPLPLRDARPTADGKKWSIYNSSEVAKCP